MNNWAEGAVQDWRFALRSFWKNPGFTAAAVSALALGIGANTAIFSVVNATLLNPLPFKNLRAPERLAMLWEHNPALNLFAGGRLPVRMKSYRAWLEQSHSFEGLALYNDATFNLTEPGDAAGRKPERVEAGVVTAGFLPLLGIRPQLGRNFNAAEMQTGKEHVAILTHELFLSRFGGNPNVIGKFLYADGQAYAIIGILAAGFEMPAAAEGFEQAKPQMLVPVNMSPGGDAEGQMNYAVYGRLKRGVTLERARAEMRVISERLNKENEKEYNGFGAVLYSLAEEDTGPNLRRLLVVLQVAVGFVLLIACANVGNLLLTRAIRREKEIAVRLALGAGRLRLIRQLLSESVLLSALGGLGGLVLAYWTLRAISYFAPDDTHGFHELRIDLGVLLFTIGVTLGAGLLFGLAPSFHALGQNVNAALGRGARGVGGTSNRLRSVLVVCEVALTLVLLIGAGLMIRSLSALMATDLGFQVDHLFTLQVTLPAAKYKTPAQLAAFNDQLLNRVRQVPGVRAAALTNALPMRSVQVSSYKLEGKPTKNGEMLTANCARVSDGYFETMRSRIIQGRTFQRNEVVAAQAVAVVSEGFARTNWPGQNPLGKVLIANGEEGNELHYPVIGIVGDEHQMGPDAGGHAEFYLPGKQLDAPILIARTMGDPLAMAAAIKKQVWEIDAEEPVTSVHSMEEVLHEWSAPRRFNMTVLLYFAGAALLLATVGLYSVLAYSVSLRTREIGIRVALGAQPRQVAGFVVNHGLRLALLGVAAGTAAALGLTRFMQSLIYGVGENDPYTFILMAAAMMAIALAASYLPARQAARIDPVDALRLE
jgi:predicted permease